MAMLGEQFMVGDEICGAVISIRFQVCTGLFAQVLVLTASIFFCFSRR